MTIDPCHASLVFGYVWFLFSGFLLILLHIYMLQKAFYFNDKNVALPFTSVILQLYLPITGTSLQRPLFSVPKMVIVERFDCTGKIIGQIHAVRRLVTTEN